MQVGVVTDPGLPAAVARAATRGLPELLGRDLGGRFDWRVETFCDELLLDEEGVLPMLTAAEEYQDRHGWDMVVLITDLPRRSGTQPILADVSTSQQAALVSLPALGGGFRLRARLRGLLVHVIGHVARDRLGLAAERLPDPYRGATGRLSARLAPLRHHTSPEERIDFHLGLTGLRGRFRLLAGMVRDNRPWRLVPHLAGATAAAAATAAFGIFYPSIWSMADALPHWRLGVISAVAIAVMVLWLLLYNDLWDRPSGHPRPGEAVLYNLSTVLTLVIGVGCMYLMLYGLALLTASAVIDLGFLQSRLGHPAGFGDYATLVWLASSMGIVAGALGSSLEGEEAVRQATYSRRENQRQARNRARADDEDARDTQREEHTAS
ncbi:hypothetical protein HOY81_18585 [Streptomyces sp. JJ36]|nr:hypothetical protein [Streptomyces sp. JJ36]